MTWRDYLLGIDDSDRMTTSKCHLAELCEIVQGQEWRILELGSHAGLSAAALAIAAPESTVVAVDLCDTVAESSRSNFWQLIGVDNIQPVKADAGRFLRESQLHLEPWDFIFHDAVHGEAALPEYLTAAGLCTILAIHDFEQLGSSSQEQVRGRFARSWESDDERGRRLFIGSH